MALYHNIRPAIVMWHDTRNGSMRRVDTVERRARLARRHLLADPGKDPTEVAASLVALHSSDPSTVYLTVWARVRGFEVADLETCLYDQRNLLRVYGMRRTLWVVDREVLRLVDNSTTRLIAPAQRRRMIKVLEDGDLTDDGAAWLESVIPKALDVIRKRGQALGREITAEVPELAEKFNYKNKAGQVIATVGVATNTLALLALESRITRGRPVGSWLSSQYRWVEMETWMDAPIPDLRVDLASAELLRAWLRGFGPATENDIKWWTGWPLRQVRRALADIGVVEVDLGHGATGFLLPDDVEPVPPPDPWVALLPSLDPTAMGWKDRDWYLGEHSSVLFDRNGNAGATIWANGNVVGGWAQRKTGEVVYELLEDLEAGARTAIKSKVAELQGWLGETIVNPRFRSPHDKRLTA